MKSSKIVAISFIVIAVALGVTPMVVSNSTDKKIEAYKAMLANHGLKQEITKKEGYFVTKRDFTLEVVDASKVMNFLLDKLVEKNQQYILLVKTIQESSKPEEINAVLNGLKFRGEMEHCNLLPADRKVSLIWDRLPNSVANEEAKKIINPLLARGVFAWDITLDKERTLKQIAARDIKEKIIFDDEQHTLDINTVGHKLDISNESNITKVRLELGKQLFEMFSKDKPEEGNISSNMEKLVYNFNIKDDFNSDGSLHIGKYHLVVNIKEAEEVKEAEEFGFGNFKVTSKVQEEGDGISIHSRYGIEELFFNGRENNFKLHDFSAAFMIDGFKTERMKRLQKASNTFLLNVVEAGDSKEKFLENYAEEDLMNLGKDLYGIVNDGISITLSSTMTGFKSQDKNTTQEIKNMQLDVIAKLPKNDYKSMNSNNLLALLSLLDINIKVKIHKDDRILVEKTEPSSKRYLDLGIEKDDYFIYELIMKNSAFMLNGQPLR